MSNEIDISVKAERWPVEKNALVAKIAEVAENVIFEDAKALLEHSAAANRTLIDIFTNDAVIERGIREGEPVVSAKDKVAAVRAFNDAKRELMKSFGEGADPVTAAVKAAIMKAASEQLDFEGYKQWDRLGRPGSKPKDSSPSS